MGQVVSFEGYTPAARFDAIPWEQVRVEEAAAAAGPWVLIDTLALVPVDADPAAPRLRNLTTSEASETPDLWYRLTFVDGAGGTGEPTTPVQNVAEPPLTISPYVSLEAFKEWAGIKVSTGDLGIEAALAAATAAINSECDRDFHAVSATGADEERYFSAERPRTLEIDDTLEIFELAVDLAGTGTFASIWELNRDYVLEPLNAPAKGRPYERVKVMPYRFSLPIWPRGVRITAVYGWAAVPDGVIKATLLLTNRLKERKATPYGIASFGSEVAMRLLRTDPDLQLLLNDLQRDTVVY